MYNANELVNLTSVIDDNRKSETEHSNRFFRPYVTTIDNKKLLNRRENWGSIQYDYNSDLFSMQIKSRVQNILPKAPLGVYWLVTAPCNLRCIHCYGNVEELPRQPLTEKEQLIVADKIIESGAMRVTLNGGEPLLRKDTPLIIEKLVESNIAVVLGTNGTFLKQSMMNTVKKTSLVEISFDSHIESVNNSIRVSRASTGNAYKESLAAIELCVSNDTKLRVLTCLNNYNYQHIESIADTLYARGVRDWSISWTLFAGRARFIYKELMPQEIETISLAIKRVKEKYPELKIKYSNRSDTSTNNKYSCLVFPNGRVFAEDLIAGKKIAYESLLKKPLLDSWNKENFNLEQHLARWTGERITYV